MKNFLEILDINLNNQLEIKIELTEHKNSQYTFTVNGVNVMPVMHFGLLDHLNFNCLVSDGAVEIIKITVNGLEIMPLYQHLANPKTSWITNHWSLAVNEPFYPWYHQITGQGWIA